MALVPDDVVDDMQYELISEKGQIKHAANSLYQYYCKLRNHKTKFCFPSLKTTVKQTGIKPKSNVVQPRNYLFEIGWIHIYPTGVIQPLKGWIPNEQVLLLRVWRIFLRPVFVLLIRMPVLHNRMIVLLIRTLFKGNLNQPIEPTQLTSEGAESAPHTSPDKIFKNQSAGKSAPRSSAEVPTNAALTRKPTDERRFHPAIAMVKEITGRFPDKQKYWDRIIREIGDKKEIGEKPITNFFRESFETWVGYGGSVTNLNEWLFVPNITGKPPQRFERNGFGNGNGKPPDVPKNPISTATEKTAPIAFDERILKAHLEDLRNEGLSDEDLNSLEENYTPESWAWLMENLKNA